MLCVNLYRLHLIDIAILTNCITYQHCAPQNYYQYSLDYHELAYRSNQTVREHDIHLFRDPRLEPSYLRWKLRNILGGQHDIFLFHGRKRPATPGRLNYRWSIIRTNRDKCSIHTNTYNSKSDHGACKYIDCPPCWWKLNTTTYIDII